MKNIFETLKDLENQISCLDESELISLEKAKDRILAKDLYARKIYLVLTMLLLMAMLLIILISMRLWRLKGLFLQEIKIFIQLLKMNAIKS